jgi:sodium-dependent phosphate transporter
MAIKDGFKQLRSTARGLAVLFICAVLSSQDRVEALISDNTQSFTWIVAFAFIAAFVAAYGIGANDVANSFATSVGAKSITLYQAVSLAAVFEFLGAVLMGSQVSETMKSGIADVECFAGNPGLLIWGMTCVLILVAFWLIFASYLEMPVSTTHSCVGGIIGMTMMVRGSNCVLWNEPIDDFPYISGVAAIVLSWVLSPVFSGIVAALIYGITYITVLKDTESSFQRTKYAFPFIVAFTVAINAGMFILKGSKGKSDDFGTTAMVDNAKDGDGHMLAITILVTAAVSFGLTFLMMPLLIKKIESNILVTDQLRDILGYAKVADGEASIEMQESVKNIDGDTDDSGQKSIEDGDKTGDEGKEGDIKDSNTAERTKMMLKRMSTRSRAAIVNTPLEDLLDYGVQFWEMVKREINADPLAVISESEITTEMHENYQKHDSNTEEMFKYVQVFTAIVDSFSHGANDIANAMGPFAAIWTTYTLNAVPSKKEDVGDAMYWILAFGGVGMIFGLATYGYKIMAAMGVKLVAVTPSRGFAIELGAAFIIMYGSTQGWPLSTTHCQVGATVGVGLFEGRKGVDPWVLLRAVVGWLLTLVVVGLGAALLVGPNPETPCDSQRS